jgi:hypothetical protein
MRETARERAPLFHAHSRSQVIALSCLTGWMLILGHRTGTLWQDPLKDLVTTFTASADTLAVLLSLVEVFPEESMNSVRAGSEEKRSCVADVGASETAHHGGSAERVHQVPRAEHALCVAVVVGVSAAVREQH